MDVPAQVSFVSFDQGSKVRGCQQGSPDFKIKYPATEIDRRNRNQEYVYFEAIKFNTKVREGCYANVASRSGAVRCSRPHGVRKKETVKQSIASNRSNPALKSIQDVHRSQHRDGAYKNEFSVDILCSVSKHRIRWHSMVTKFETFRIGENLL
ncbi:hypothetical protein AVEN_72563-1 [Araneus ventricosus]|uniref:Uncharacterized protein n=1 Tax=Araneus ventricosus TaxID=182803 RepID=A0A4Y2MKL3_ARAVE|nr:hypothetical protein AVEN_72563-1 [Araneus ventricosus]